MGYDGSLKFDTEINEKGFSSGVKRLGSFAKGGLTVLAGAVSGVAAAMGAGAAAGIKYNASIEQYKTSFEVMTGSAEKATDVIERLKKIGAETPFELPQLADTTQLLMNYGFTADEAMDKMMMLGDISQGSADKMSRITMAYGQMSSAGKVQLEDVKQMIEAGFNPLQEISESTGESMESLYNRISKGTISVDEITASMERATSEGGKYFKSMEKQSQTVSGMISTLKDNAQQLLGDVVKPITESIGTQLLPTAIDAIEQLTTAFKTNGVEGLIEAGSQIIVNLLLGIVQGLPNVILTAVQIIQSIIDNLNLNLPQILAAGGQILMALINGAIALSWQLGLLAINIVSALATGIIENLPQIIQKGNELLTGFLQAVQARFPELVQNGCQMIVNLLTGILQQAPTIIQEGTTLLSDFVKTILNALPTILSSGKDMILSLLDGLIAEGPKIISEIGKDLVEFAAEIASHLPEILQKGIEIIGELLAGIIQKVPDVISAIPGIISEIGSEFLNKDWAGIGWDIIKGIGSGIKSAASDLVSAAVQAAKDAVAAVKGWLGIKSPSRLMRDQVGKYMALGMGIGFEKNIPVDDMQKSLSNPLKKIKRTALDVTMNTPSGVNRAAASESVHGNPSTDDDTPIIINNTFEVDGTPLISKTTKAVIKKIDSGQKDKKITKGR